MAKKLNRLSILATILVLITVLTLKIIEEGGLLKPEESFGTLGSTIYNLLIVAALLRYLILLVESVTHIVYNRNSGEKYIWLGLAAISGISPFLYYFLYMNEEYPAGKRSV
jgi:hypothetical protein